MTLCEERPEASAIEVATPVVGAIQDCCFSNPVLINGVAGIVVATAL
ncbi:MAG: hypothetical protein ACK47S_06585 [Paracoccaceae bacterium]|jgi:hypothetical protein